MTEHDWDAWEQTMWRRWWSMVAIMLSGAAGLGFLGGLVFG